MNAKAFTRLLFGFAVFALVSCAQRSRQKEETVVREKDFPSFSSFVGAAAREGFVLLKNDDSFLPRPPFSDFDTETDILDDDAILIVDSLADAQSAMQNDAVKSVIYAPLLPAHYAPIRQDVLKKMVRGDFSPSGALPFRAENLPLGLGLTYTQFSQRITQFDFDAASGKINLQITVQNTGKHPARAIIKLFFFDSPNTDSPDASPLGENALAAFYKTPEIPPEERAASSASSSVIINIAVNIEDFAKYDDAVARAYVLKAGSYKIALMENEAHIIDSAAFRINSSLIYDDEHAGRRSTDRLSAKNRLDTLRSDGWVRSFTDETLGYTAGDKSAFGKNAGLRLEDMAGVSIENALWDDFASQLSQQEAAAVVSNDGFLSSEDDTRAYYRVGKPEGKIAGKASAFWERIFGRKKLLLPALKIFKSAKVMERVPSMELIFATWDTEVAKLFGATLATETQNMRYDFWALRQPEAVTRESAQMMLAAAAASHSAGTGVFLDTRSAIRSAQFADEQDVREKLLGMELAVKSGGITGIISGIDLNMFSGIIRNEWGYTGALLSTDESFREQALLDALKTGDKPILTARTIHRDAKYILYLMANRASPQ